MSERQQQDRGAVVYDFVHPEHRLGAEWPVLEQLHQRVVDAFGRRLRECFHVSLGERPEPTRRVRYDRFVDELDAQVLVHEIALGPEPGVVLFCLEAATVPALVDGWFGGRPVPPAPEAASADATREAAEGADASEPADGGNPDDDASSEASDAEPEPGGPDDASGADADTDAEAGGATSAGGNARPMATAVLGSATERRAYRHVLDAVVGAISETWAGVADLGPRPGKSTTVERLARGGYGEVVIDCPLQLVLDELVMHARLVFPVALLEPFSARLSEEDHSHPVKDPRFQAALGAGLMDCELEIRGVLAETRITLAQLMAMKPGDFIPLKDMQNVSFRTNHTPLFDARVGNTNGRVSASLSRWHLPTRL